MTALFDLAGAQVRSPPAPDRARGFGPNQSRVPGDSHAAPDRRYHPAAGQRRDDVAQNLLANPHQT